MIKIENVEVYGWETAIRGARNSWTSWSKSDSAFKSDPIWHDINNAPHMIVADDQAEAFGVYIGSNDLKLMQNLSNTGRGSERKYLRFITVTCDVTAPLYWWKEQETYKVGTVANSTSTMHSIMSKKFELDDFSHEHLYSEYGDNIFMSSYNPEIQDYINSNDILIALIDHMNECRDGYLFEKDPEKKKIYWWQIIQLLPASYNQRRTVLMNYEVLANQYKDRRNHKLDEWQSYCDWIESLPYSKLITGNWKED